jgi:hypothetical protein
MAEIVSSLSGVELASFSDWIVQPEIENVSRKAVSI